MSQHTVIDATVAALGYELVEVERAPGGLLRVTIDHLAVEGEPERFINVDDCERVTRQLQHVLEVEGLPYERLEVSSPGLDRPLKSAADFHEGLRTMWFPPWFWYTELSGTPKNVDIRIVGYP